MEWEAKDEDKEEGYRCKELEKDEESLKGDGER